MADGNWEEDRLTGRWEVFKDQPNNGWIEWHGGPPPFTSGNMDVRLRSGRLIFYRGVVDIGGRTNPGGNWAHLGERADIIAYRRHPEKVFVRDPNEEVPF